MSVQTNDVSAEASQTYSPRLSSPVAVPPEPRLDWLADYPPPRSLPLDQEALRIYEHAYAIGLTTEKPRDPRVTYSTVLMALLTGSDETSRWFAQEATTNGPLADSVFAERGLTPERLPRIAWQPGRPEQIELSSDKQLLTTSARAVLESALQWAQRVGGSDIGVRHLVAAYVINPPSAHGAQMQRWRYQGTAWRSAFFSWVAERYTAEQWTDTRYRPAPAKRTADFEQLRVKGAALAFPGDEETLAVLDRASALHARTTDKWLRHQTVFCALVECARDDDDLRQEIQPVWDAVAAAEGTYLRLRDRLFPPAAADREAPSFSELDISSRVLNTLETARELALATRHEAGDDLRVGVLQLAGAVLSRRVDAQGEVAKFGVVASDVRELLIRHARARGESVELWREAVGDEEALFDARPIDLNSDEPEAAVRRDEHWESDPLRIRKDVETFAALLASSTLEPPLSIGLFGPWGSGKTTFLKRLRRAVDARARKARVDRAAGMPTPYVGNVVHVEFNAWHFAEGALVSSLVDTILRALGDYIRDEQPKVGKAWRERSLEALVSTRRKVEAAVAVEQAAAAAVDRAERQLAATRADAAKALTSVQSLAQAVWSATKAALATSPDIARSGVLEASGDAVKSVEQLRDRLNALRSRPARLLADLGWRSSLLFAAMVLVFPPLVAWLVARVAGSGQTIQLLSAATAALSVVATWARAASGAASRVDAAITRVVDEYADRVARDEQVARAQSELDASRASAETAVASVRAAREELAKARTDAANASLPAQMLQLVSSRIDGQTYTRELTSLSLARADLQALSTMLCGRDDGAHAGAATDDVSSSLRAVDRVILYIDDLDRCRPREVVRVLQLVHMLLAFELFAVVVAVDANWVYEALKYSYAWLEEADAGAPDGDGRREAGAVPITPQDYLEKIFQIAFWLEPMTSGRVADYLKTLVPDAVREEGSVYGSNIRPPAYGGAPDDTGGAPAAIGIAAVELDYLCALAAHVGSSPRRVKRLLNAYRLIKASLSDSQLSAFLTERAALTGEERSGPYQIVIGLLVIGTGAPGSSARILGELSECDPTLPWETIVEGFRERRHPDWTLAARVLETVMPTQRSRDMGEVRGWARKVGRFLLNGPAGERLSSEPPPVTEAIA